MKWIQISIHIYFEKIQVQMWKKVLDPFYIIWMFRSFLPSLISRLIGRLVAAAAVHARLQLGKHHYHFINSEELALGSLPLNTDSQAS